MTAIKLVALDMDGTLLDEHSRITDGVREAIREARAQGITVMFATGRGRPSLEPYRVELGLDGPIVAVNGSEVWRTPDELLFRHTMEPEIVLALREIAVREDCWFWAYTTEGVYNRENWEKLPGEARSLTWLKFGYFTEDLVQLERIRERVRETGEFEMTNSHPHNMELNPAGVSKASGILAVCRELGLAMSRVMAVGDSLNDAAMLKAAGLGIAMGNAQEEVKRLAHAVTGTNEEDGVAEAIRRYVLGGGR